jgi:hypothetical protein
MPKVTITKDEGDRPARELLAPGNYELEIVDHEFGVTQKGDDKLNLQVVENNTKCNIWCNLMFTDKTGWKVKSLLRALNVGEEGVEVDVNDDMCGRMKGSKVWANVGIDEYNGTRRNQITRFHNEKPSPADDEEFK